MTDFQKRTKEAAERIGRAVNLIDPQWDSAPVHITGIPGDAGKLP